MGFGRGPQIVTDGLVSALDAANSKSYPGTGTTWNDLSGNSNNGTLTNGPTFDSGNGGSIVFDGVDDFVTIPHDSTQSFSGNFSIEAVIYPTANTANCIIQKGSGNDYYQEYWLLQDMRGSNRSFSLIMGKTGNTSANYISTGNISVVNTFHHVIATVNGATATIYVNNVQEGTGTISNRIQSTSALRIGRRVDNFATAAGKIPKVKLYSRSLTLQEIQQNYNATKSRFGL